MLPRQSAVGTTLLVILRALSPWAKRQITKARLSSFVAWTLVCSDLDFAWSRLVIFSWLRAVDQKSRGGAQICWHPHVFPWEEAKSPSAPSTSCLMALRVCFYSRGTKQYLMLPKRLHSVEHHAPGEHLSQCRGGGRLFSGLDRSWAG